MAHIWKVLSIDGGGIRGIIPATVLGYIEEKTGQPVSRLFDLVTGTSTGGILALTLTKPDPNSPELPQYSAKDLVAFYEREGPRVFPGSTSLSRKVRQAVMPKYSERDIEKVLARYLGDARLSDSLTNVVVTAYDIERRAPFFFKSRKARHNPEGDSLDFTIKDAARATSAAPTYLAPAAIFPLRSETRYALIDGGVFAGNPAMCAYAEVKKAMFQPGDQILLVSLGTGKCDAPIPYGKAKRWGAFQWLLPLLEVSLNGSDTTVDYQLQRILPRDMYFRLQKKLELADDSLDNATPENLRNLRLEADRLVTANKADLDRLCALLLENRG